MTPSSKTCIIATVKDKYLVIITIEEWRCYLLRGSMQTLLFLTLPTFASKPLTDRRVKTT